MIGSVADAAVVRALDRLEAAAIADLPEDITVDRLGDRLVLRGANLRLRWLTDVRLWGLGVGLGL